MPKILTPNIRVKVHSHWKLAIPNSKTFNRRVLSKLKSYQNLSLTRAHDRWCTLTRWGENLTNRPNTEPKTVAYTASQRSHESGVTTDAVWQLLHFTQDSACNGVQQGACVFIYIHYSWVSRGKWCFWVAKLSQSLGKILPCIWLLPNTIGM